MGLNAFQKSMFRAGHAHAGVLVILAIIAQVLVVYAGLSKGLEWMVRIGFPLSAILISGDFLEQEGNDITEPIKLIWLLYIGAVILGFFLLMFGIGLIINRCGHSIF